MMSPNEVLAKLESKSKMIQLEGIDVEVKGLTFPELAHLAPHMDRKNTEYVIKYIGRRTLEKAFPEWKDREVESFLERVNPKYLVKMVNTVKEISMPDEKEVLGDAEKKEEPPKEKQ